MELAAPHQPGPDRALDRIPLLSDHRGVKLEPAVAAHLESQTQVKAHPKRRIRTTPEKRNRR